MADSYPGLSTYNYCANNPLLIVDPNGMDWYQKNGLYIYDPHVTAESHMSDGMIYIGENFKNDYGTFNSDGSVLFSDSKEAMKFMHESEKQLKTEQMGLLTKKGIFVLPSYLKEGAKLTPEKYNYHLLNHRAYNSIKKTTLKFLTFMHTHPADADRGATSDDYHTAFRAVKTNPWFIMELESETVTIYRTVSVNHNNVADGAPYSESVPIQSLMKGKTTFNAMYNKYVKYKIEKK